MIKCIILGLFTSVICVNIFAQSASLPVSQFTPTTQAQYCPSLNELTLNSNTRIWSAKNGWKSYDESFATGIGQFLGAQWIGIGVGQIACIYSGKNKFTFPILLVHNKLVKTPEGGLWKKNTTDGHYHCVTHLISQCPFYPIVSHDNSSNTKNLIDTLPYNPVQSQVNF
jgi:hypothetical protein